MVAGGVRYEITARRRLVRFPILGVRALDVLRAIVVARDEGADETLDRHGIR